MALSVRAELGVSEFDMAPFGNAELHRRHFFHLEADGDLPETWSHSESHPSRGESGSMVFEFFWARLPDEVPDLIAGHGAMLHRLP